jgi:hypothetical protein
MAERGDMTVLHEPFCNLRDYGETDAGARTFDSPLSLLAWLRDETNDMRVFLKDHPPTAYVLDVLADRRFLAEARHAFRSPTRDTKKPPASPRQGDRRRY